MTKLINTLATTLTLTALCSFAVPALTAATAPIITYTASGTFATPATSGSDTLRLAGEPFSVSIAVSSATTPYKTGKNYAAYNKLKLTGTVHSGLLGTSPINIASGQSTIIQAINPGVDDLFTLEAPITVVGISITLKAQIAMPLGTITKPLLTPFAKAIALAPGNATMTYSDGTASTVLGIQTGSLTATIPAAAAVIPAVTLHTGGAQVLTLNNDGTTSARSVSAAPVNVGFSTDSVALKFYAAGVSGASEVHVLIGGVEVPVVYAAASGYFPGLDEVVVKTPWTLAGRGATDVTLTADGQTAEPVRIQIQ